VGVEEPYFTSACEESDAKYKTLSARRLSPEDFDETGRRKLSHWPRKTYSFELPLNQHAMRPGKHTLYLEAKKGLNGQLRLMETSKCVDCNGITFAYSRTAATDADYWYYNVQAQNSAPTVAVTDQKHDIVAKVLMGKQRNTFGPYMVVNKDFDEIEIWGYDKPAGASDVIFKKWWTSPAEASVEYLGAHEFHWFPYKSLLMAKLGDGSSFRLFRLAANFRDVATAVTANNLAASFEMVDWIDNPFYRLFHISGRTMVPPRFWKKMAYFYVSPADAALDPKLVAYEWNDLTNEFERKCEQTLANEAALQALYHKFSFVSVGDDGVIFSQANSATFKVYKCSDPGPGWSMTEAAVTIDDAAGAEAGA